MREFIKPELCKRLSEVGCGNYATVTGRPDIKLLKNVSFQEAFCMLPEDTVMGIYIEEYGDMKGKFIYECSYDDKDYGNIVKKSIIPIEALESMLEKLLDEGYKIKDGRLCK